LSNGTLRQRYSFSPGFLNGRKLLRFSSSSTGLATGRLIGTRRSKPGLRRLLSLHRQTLEEPSIRKPKRARMPRRPIQFLPSLAHY